MEAEEPVIIEGTARTTQAGTAQDGTAKDGKRQKAADSGLPPKPKRKYPRRAEIWRHYKLRNEDDVEANCKYCGVPIGCDTVTAGTSAMKGHIKICKNYKDFMARETQQALGTDNHGNMRVIKYD